MLLKGRMVKPNSGNVFNMPALKKQERTTPGRPASGGYAVTAGDARRTEEIERDAYEKGFAVGENSGLEMGRQKAEVLLGRLEKIIAEFEQMKKQVVQEVEPQIMELALQIARRILMEELSLKPELIVAMVREALRRIEKTGTVTIRINPALYELFLELKPGLLEMHSDIVFETDQAVAPSGAVIIGDKEEVLTDIDLQLKNMRDGIEGNLGSR